MTPPLLVISDVHLGDPHCRRELLLHFLDALPNGCTLVLNGDILDDPRVPLPTPDQVAWLRLGETARRVSLVWLWGNHDNGCRPTLNGPVQFAAEHHLEQRLLVRHGDEFMRFRGHHHCFIALFRRLHNLRVRLGAAPVHVSHYAKKWRWFYATFCREVRENAVAHAQAGGYAAIACGHTHAVEDCLTPEGIRYLNTGSWTEAPTRCLVVTPEAIQFCDVEDWLAAQPPAPRRP